MDFIGTWKVKKSMVFTDDGMKHLTKEEMIANDIEVESDMFSAVVVFKEDGTYETMVQIPEDQIEAAKAEGAPVDENGCICVGASTWYEKNGAYYFEQGGEECPIEITEEGLLKFSMGMTLLEKI